MTKVMTKVVKNENNKAEKAQPKVAPFAGCHASATKDSWSEGLNSRLQSGDSGG